jgi:[acyl-carrier-protein] S-malonyltransferase
MSTVTAKLEDAHRMGALLLEQLTAPVKFTQAVRGLVKDGADMFVEIGPGQVLSGLLRRCDRSLRTTSVSDPESLRKLQEQLTAA